VSVEESPSIGLGEEGQTEDLEAVAPDPATADPTPGSRRNEREEREPRAREENERRREGLGLGDLASELADERGMLVGIFVGQRVEVANH
jgi:hypothetical protein